MNKLATPFGDIDIQIDGKSVPYTAVSRNLITAVCPDLLGRYQIEISFQPDGKEHEISCTFQAYEPYNKTGESGERLECQSFYNDRRYKMSIGLKGEAEHFPDNLYDYNADYLENGMAYLISAETKTNLYVFGIAWIDDVGWDDPVDDEHNRDVQTWFGADPTLYHII